MGIVPISALRRIKQWYYRDMFTMREVGEHLGVSLDAVAYFMRHHRLPRRTLLQANRIRFDKKPPSFKSRAHLPSFTELKAIGAMLYWGEGYKNCTTNSTVDFANSDSGMISLFLLFLRKVYGINEVHLRVYLYCYADQDVGRLVHYWSRVTGIPKERFSKPYVRKDFRKNGRKMRYGLIHIRYYDKKLLLEILRLIEYYKSKYIRAGTQVVNEGGL